jgi:hypothetical protein
VDGGREEKGGEEAQVFDLKNGGGGREEVEGNTKTVEGKKNWGPGFD